jgi:dienelactone hydrolase
VIIGARSRVGCHNAPGPDGPVAGLSCNPVTIGRAAIIPQYPIRNSVATTNARAARYGPVTRANLAPLCRLSRLERGLRVNGWLWAATAFLFWTSAAFAETEPPAGAGAPEPSSQPVPLAAPAPASAAVPVAGAEPAVKAEPAITPDSAAKPEPFTASTASIELAGQDQRVDIYRPAAGPANGVAIVAHGFNRSRIRHRDLGRALATAGIVAVIPDLPNFLNLWGNGDSIVELAHKLEAGALGLAPIERGHLVLIGTSAGGLATVLAAAELPGLAGWIGLDPVDRTDTGIAAAAKLTSPAVVFLAPSGGCNLFASGRSIARAVPGLRRLQVFDGASHCDFEDPTNKFCRVVCGESSPQMQARIRNETVSAALEFLLRRAGPAAPGAPSPE